ncbi:hypothetical protein WJX73_001792 [Symbiochloris irregularis]|uniref:WW domain-containing protein n=1 Tax=Symbiochloris irregularis TaxID=706552 RepID=A0AAW1Q299_9CHLO
MSLNPGRRVYLLSELSFGGRVQYAYKAAEAEDLCQRLLGSSITDLGFDAEWKIICTPSGVAVHKPVALVQLCYLEPSHRIHECLLLHIKYAGIPPSLKLLLEREDILKAGVGIKDDANRLAKEYGIQMKGCMSLGDVADLHIKSSKGGRHGRDLRGLAEELLGKTLNKDASRRCSNWEELPLSREQKLYAATDAYASLCIGQVLSTMPRLVQPAVSATSHLSEPADSAMPDERVPAAAVMAPLGASQQALHCLVVQQGKSLEAAAADREIQLSTAESYLAEAMLAGFPYSWRHLEEQEEDESRSNKRKFDGSQEEEPEATKRVATNGLESTTRVSGFSDAPAATATAPTAAIATPAVAAPAGGMDPDAPPPGQQSDSVDIPAAMVGKLIGKGGETIKNLQYSTGTKVQIDHQTPGDTKRVTIFAASRESIDNCKRQVEQIVADETTDHSRTVECPQGIVGRIIGRGGETIRALQQASQAHIVVDQNFPEGHPRRVIVSGRQDAVERAEKMIKELITGEPGSAQSIIQKYGAGITRTVECPKTMVGRVIGKGGETIKLLQKQYGANIQIDQGSDPMKVSVAGQPQAVEGALMAVQEIINGGNPPFLPGGGASPYGGGGPRGPPGAGYGPQGGGYGGAQYGQQPGGFPGFQGYGAPQAQPQAAYGGYPGYGGQFPPGAYGQPQAVAQVSGGYGSHYGQYGQQADPYGAQQSSGGGYGGYGGGGGGQGAAPQQSAPSGGSTWQELRDGEGRSYYYNTQTGVSQWEKPAEMA